MHTAAATSIVAKVMTETINEERDPKPPSSAAAAMATTRGTLAVPGALVSQLETRMISLTLGTRGAPNS